MTNEQVETHALDRGIRYRGIYDHDALDESGRLDQIRTMVHAGERARVLKDLPLKLALIDDSALVPLLAYPDDQRSLVIHRSALVEGLYVLFELLWQRAIPLDLAATVGADAAPQETCDRDVLTLLAAGLPDKVIARQLGLSLRTVARRVGTLMQHLDAQTRFQAGVHAAARGWLHVEPAPGQSADWISQSATSTRE